MASINQHKIASVHGNFCPRRLSWKAPCSCGAEHTQGCKAVSVDFNDLGTCDCGVDAPRDVSKYGVASPLGVMVSQGVREAWSTGEFPTPIRDDSPFPYRNGRMVSMDGDAWIDERLLGGEVSPSRREAEVRNRQDEDEILYGNQEADEPQGVVYARSESDADNEGDVREPGFYWVRIGTREWEPAEWRRERWECIGVSESVDIVDEITAVGARIIERASLEECVHCCEPCRDLYQVNDSVWCGEAGWSKTDVAHLRCLEKRIFRRLNSRDFIDDPINDGWIHFFRERTELIALVKATIRSHDEGLLAGKGDSVRIERLRELIG